jgi:N-acetylglutamate synthase-like GNAT family acetyltransferase
MRVEQYKSQHFVDIKMRPQDLEEMEGIDVFQRASELEQGFGYTLYNEDNEIAACIGIYIEERDGVLMGAPWLATSAAVEQMPRSLLKLVAELKQEAQEIGLKKLYTFLFKGHEQSKRWLEYLGFKVLVDKKEDQNKLMFADI